MCRSDFRKRRSFAFCGRPIGARGEGAVPQPLVLRGQQLLRRREFGCIDVSASRRLTALDAELETGKHCSLLSS